MSATRIPVTHVGTYRNSGLGVTIRRDLKRDHEWAFVAAPPQFVADADQLRQLADAMHDLADQLDAEK